LRISLRCNGLVAANLMWRFLITYVGTIAEVEVNRKTGALRVTRFVCAHDCGLIINREACAEPCR
jgi:CO/xanthine dehydrogenase Mo-binding subunit